MSHRILSPAAALLALTAIAAPAVAQKAPSTDDEKTLYALGLSVARSLESFQLKPAELEFVLAGLRDEIGEAEPKVSLEEFGPRIRTLAESRTQAAAAEERVAGQEFLAQEAAVSGATKTESGLVKRVLVKGDGESPQPNDMVKVNYKGTLRDGTVFDSSEKHGEPAQFRLGGVIPCWTEALQTMKVGEKSHITCPADLAYGDRGFPGTIPPGSTLAFDVELLEILDAESVPPTPPGHP